VHDLELFGVVNTHAKDLEKEIKENFLKSKIFNWLITRLKKSENQTKCDVCNLELPTPERLERHKKKAHGNVPEKKNG